MKDKLSPVLISGCSSGLGFATARAFRAAGWTTIASAREPSALRELAELGCEILPLDVTREASRHAAVTEVERRHGPIGVLVNNAGYGQYGPLEEISPEALRSCFDVNVFGLLRMTQLCLPGMRQAKRGRIVNISSIAGQVSVAGGGVYHMTKFAVEAIADALRPEVKPFGIDVVNILPGPFLSSYRDKVVASLPDTGADSPYTVFKGNVARYMMNFLRPGGFDVMTADHVAATVLRAATARRPRTRYRVGTIATLGSLGRALTPDRLADAYMNWQIPPGRSR